VPRILSEDEIQDFRTSLCEVAERLFADCGYEGVTLRAIAAELGCSPMTPYRYFDNKEAIFTAVRMAAFTLAHLAGSSMHGLVTLELSQKLLLGRDYDELVEPLMDFFLRGIGAPPDSSESGADA